MPRTYKGNDDNALNLLCAEYDLEVPAGMSTANRIALVAEAAGLTIATGGADLNQLDDVWTYADENLAVISCVFPLDMSEAAVQSLPFGATGRPTMSEDFQTATLTLVGDPGETLAYYAVTGGAETGDGWRLDLTSGIKVIEFPITLPLLNGGGSSAVAAWLEWNMSTIGGSAGAAFVLQNWGDNYRSLTLYRTGASALLISGQELLSRIAVEFDCDNGTLRWFVDDVEQTLGSNNFTPGEYIAYIRLSEHADSPAGNADKVIGVGMVTQADNMTGTHYAEGATDPCGNEIAA